MEYRVLKYFLAVADEGSITHAAEVLHISQPALSRQLMQLEEELGAQLFVRGQRRITLTEKGMLLRSRAREIVELTEKTEKEFADSSSSDTVGTIAIGAGELASFGELSLMFAEFGKTYPKITFDIFSSAADVATERLEKGLLDFALLVEPVDYAKYNHFRMKTVEYMGIIMPPNHKLAQKEFVTADDLQGETLILPGRESVKTRFATWMGASADSFSCCNLANNAALMVEKGLGLAVATECVPKMYDSTRFCYRRFKPEIISHSVLVWKKNAQFGAAASEFLNFLNITMRHDNS